MDFQNWLNFGLDFDRNILKIGQCADIYKNIFKNRKMCSYPQVLYFYLHEECPPDISTVNSPATFAIRLFEVFFCIADKAS